MSNPLRECGENHVKQLFFNLWDESVGTNINLYPQWSSLDLELLPNPFDCLTARQFKIIGCTQHSSITQEFMVHNLACLSRSWQLHHKISVSTMKEV